PPTSTYRLSLHDALPILRIPMKRLVAVGAASMVFLAACGGKVGEGPGGEQGASDEPATGGTVHMLQNSDFSYLDPARGFDGGVRSEEHTSELQSRFDLVC